MQYIIILLQNPIPLQCKESRNGDKGKIFNSFSRIDRAKQIISNLINVEYRQPRWTDSNEIQMVREELQLRAIDLSRFAFPFPATKNLQSVEDLFDMENTVRIVWTFCLDDKEGCFYSSVHGPPRGFVGQTSG